MSLSHRLMLRADSEHLNQLAFVAKKLGETQSGAVRYLIRCAAQQLLSSPDAPDAEQSAPTALHFVSVSDPNGQLAATIEHLLTCHAKACVSCPVKAVVPIQNSIAP